MVAFEAVEKLEEEVNPETIIEVKVEVDESVHVHNLYVEVRDTLKNLKDNLRGRE